MITVYRYTQLKPRDGKLEFSYHRDGTILGVTEVWRKDGGWHVALDVLVDTDQPVERRRLFLCTGGDDLTPLGENAFAYHVGTNATKGYCSYVFDVTHLPDQVIAKLEANWGRLQRPAPGEDDKSYKTKQREQREQRQRETRERIERRRRENEEAKQRRLAGTIAETAQLVDSRVQADAERERIAQEQDVPQLRVVES